MDRIPRTGGWSFGGVLVAPVGRAVVRDPVGILAVPLLLQAPILAFSAIEGVRWDSMVEGDVTGSIWSIFSGTAPDPATVWGLLGWALFAVLLTCVASAFVILRTTRLLRTLDTSLEADFRHALRRAPFYFFVSVLVLALFSAGLVLLVVPGLVVLYFWLFAPILTVSDDLGFYAAFTESRRRVRGHLGAWLGSVCVFLVISFVIAIGVYAITEFTGVWATTLEAHLTANVAQGVLGTLFMASWTSFAHSLGGRAPAAGGSPAQGAGGELPETRSAAASLFE